MIKIRIVTVLAPGKSSLLKTTVRNFLKTIEKAGNPIVPEKLLIMYDKSASSDVIDLHQDEDFKKLDVETLEIPEINNLFTEDFTYKFKNHDCIIPPPLTYHMLFLLNSFNSSWTLSKNKIFIFHTESEGTISTLRAFTLDNMSRKLDASPKITLRREGKDNLNNLIKDARGVPKPFPNYNERAIKRFIEFESHPLNATKIRIFLNQFLPEKSEPQDKPVSNLQQGNIFEEIVAIWIDNHSSITECYYSITWKNKTGRKGTIKEALTIREEDTIALYDDKSSPKSPQYLLYISTKSSADKATVKKKTEHEIQRMLDLKLPFVFPSERVRKILVVSTTALQTITTQTPGLIVTNLANLHDEISNL